MACQRPCDLTKVHLGLTVLVLAVIAVGLGSCAIVRSTSARDMVGVRSQALDNGYLIALSIDRPVEHVSAFITRGRWLVVTLADSLLDVGDLSSTKPSFVDSVEVTRFPTVLQLAFRLTVRVETVEVVRDESRPDIWISLFPPRPSPRRR